MNTRRIFLGLTLALVMASGCSDDNVRSDMYVSWINNSEALTSDVYNLGADEVPSGDDYVIEDEVELEIRNLPRDGIVDVRAGKYGSMTVERYTVVFESDEEIESYSGMLGWVVPINTNFRGFLTIVPAGLKMQTPLIALQSGGEIHASAVITFYAREANSGNETTFETRVPVNFANWVDG